MTYWQCAVTFVSGRTGEGSREGCSRIFVLNVKEIENSLKRLYQKKRWFLRWESTMCASKSDEEELLELDNWRRW